MLANESSLRVYFMGRFNSKVVEQKCLVFINNGNDYMLKKNTINYAWTTNQIKEDYIECLFFFFLIFLPYQLQLKARYILFYLKLKANFCTLENLTGSKSTCSTVVYLSFQFHNSNNTVKISRSKKWITLPPYFRNREILYTSLEF